MFVFFAAAIPASQFLAKNSFLARSRSFIYLFFPVLAPRPTQRGR